MPRKVLSIRSAVVIVPVLAAVVVAAFFLYLRSTDEPLNPVEVRTTTNEGLALILSLDRTRFRVDEAFTVNLTLVNTSPDPIAFRTRTSQLFDVILGSRVPDISYSWSQDQVFAEVVTPYVLHENGSISREISWRIPLKAGEAIISGSTVNLDLNSHGIGITTPRVPITVID